jgi:hypothetical protein
MPRLRFLFIGVAVFVLFVGCFETKGERCGSNRFLPPRHYFVPGNAFHPLQKKPLGRITDFVEKVSSPAEA